MGTVRWHNTDLTRGAGVARVKKDSLLLTLAQDLGVHVTPRISRISYAPTIGTGAAAVTRFINTSLLQLIDNTPVQKEDFSAYATRILGPENYKRFCVYNGYTDYIYADPQATLQDYDFDDNETGASNEVSSAIGCE